MNPIDNSLPALTNLSLKQVRDILTPEDLFKLALTDALGRRKVFTLDLSTAGSYTMNYAGNYVKMINATDNSLSVNIKYNRPDDDATPFRLNTNEIRPFTQLFFSWSAQAGKTATFVVAFDGTNRLYSHDSFDPATNITTLAQITGQIAGLTGLPSGGALVRGRAFQSGPGAADVYQVTAGKTFYLLHAFFSNEQSGLGTAIVDLRVTDSANVLQYYLFEINSDGTGANKHMNQQFLPVTAIIPATGKIRINVATGGEGTANIIGYEV